MIKKAILILSLSFALNSNLLSMESTENGASELTIKFEKINFKEEYPKLKDRVELHDLLVQLGVKYYLDKETNTMDLTGHEEIIKKIAHYLKKIDNLESNRGCPWYKNLGSYATSLNRFYKCPNPDSMLYIALNKLSKNEVAEALKLGANPNLKIQGQPALIEVMKLQNCQKVKRLLKAGANVNATNNQGETALAISSCYNYNERITRLLVKAGSDVNTLDRYDRYPIDWILINLKKAESDLQNSPHSMSMQLKVYGLQNLVKRILKAHIDFACVRSDHSSMLDELLVYACSKDCPEKTKWLTLILKHTNSDQLDQFYKKFKNYRVAEHFGFIEYIQAETEKMNKQKLEIYPTCSICLNYCIKPFTTICNHTFHRRCLNKWLRIKKECPFCRNSLAEENTEKSDNEIS